MSDEIPQIRMFDVPVAIEVPEFALEDIRDHLEYADDTSELDVKKYLLDRVGFQPIFLTPEGEDAVEVLLEE